MLIYEQSVRVAVGETGSWISERDSASENMASAHCCCALAAWEAVAMSVLITLVDLLLVLTRSSIAIASPFSEGCCLHSGR